MSFFDGHKNDVGAAYDKYADMLYRLSMAQLGNSSDAEDAVHDVFIKYMKTLTVFRDEEHVKSWLIRVTCNVCHDVQRQRKHRNHVSLDELSQMPASTEGVDTDSMGLQQMLAQVSEKNRAAIVLHYLEDYPVEKVADILGLSLSAVKMRLMRGREELKQIMGKEET